jgi:hypothetical protein
MRSSYLARVSRRKPQERAMKTNLTRRDTVLLAPLLVLLPLTAAMPSVVAQEVPLAIKGYDPVAYFTDGKPVRGLSEFEYTSGTSTVCAPVRHRWRFSSAEHRELFKCIS